MNPQSLEGYVAPPAPPSAPQKQARKLAMPQIAMPQLAMPLVLSIAGAIVLVVAGAALAWWEFADRTHPWFVGTPLYTVRTNTIGTRIQKVHSLLLYQAGGKYSATNTVYEQGKPPAEQSYTGTWRHDGEWVCLRMDWMRDQEFCNTFVKTDQGWIVLNRADARMTPVSLVPLTPPSEQELAPPPAPAPPADCAFAGQPVAHASSVPAFEASVVPSGQPCKAEVRTCTNGLLSGAFQNARCSAAIALPPPPAKKPAPKPKSSP